MSRPLKIYNTAGYPFNLIDAIFCEETVWVDDEDHMAGLEHALLTLSDREQKVLEERFQDFKTLEEVGRDFNITRERIRQIEANALRKLRHPSRKNFIMHGYFGGAELKELKEKEEALSKREKSIEERERKLNEMLDKYKPKFDALHITIESPLEEIQEAFVNSMSIEEMDLSVRSFNCLRRANIRTVLDLIAYCENDYTGLKLLRVRNLGRKSLREVLERLYEMTGKDFRAQYGF